MKRTIGPENVNEMRQELKTQYPGTYAWIKAFFDAGLISGLRGIEIEMGEPENELEAAPVDEIVNYCEQCQHWRRDVIGDGTGIGSCLGGDTRKILHWPQQEICSNFEGVA